MSCAENTVNGSYRYRVKATNANGSSDYTTGTWNCVVAIPLTSPDINHNGIVNFIDFAELANHWLETGTDLTGDLNNDGLVDFGDVSTMADHWLTDGRLIM